ncbi:putative proteasome component Ecm29 [Plasmopara halstedii]
MSDLQKDVDALDRVLFRLASADDERMHQVLQLLLPQLLLLFPRSVVTPSELQLRDKILQVISHIKKRLQALAHPVLPLDALCNLLQQDELSVFSYNFTLLFIEIGFEVASTEEQTKVLAAVVKKISSVSNSNQEAVFRMLIRALPINPSNLFLRQKKEARSENGLGEDVTSLTNNTVEQLYENDSNVHVVLDFLMDLVLYEPPSSATVGSVPYGLMPLRLERLQRVKVTELCREILYERQLCALKFVKQIAVSTKLKLPIYLAGCASFNHAVKVYSEEQSSRVTKYEKQYLEDEALMRRLMTLVLGSQVAMDSNAFECRDSILIAERTRFADASILQTLPLLSLSVAATNVVPTILQLLCHLMLGTEPSRPPNVASKIKLASVHLCQWTVQKCQQPVVENLLGPIMLPTFLRLLLDPHIESEASSIIFLNEFRQGIYETLSGLAIRTPTLVAASEQAFQVLLVRCLAEEEHRTGAGANALKTFTTFACTYATAATPKVRDKVQHELTALLNGSKLFDSSHNYIRVRAAIAAWCAELLTASSTGDVSLRFAVLRLRKDCDDDTRSLLDKALFANPLPSVGAVARYLKDSFPIKDLKVNMRDAGAAECCVQFCLKILKASITGDSSQVDADDHRCVLEYMLQTLLGPTESSNMPRTHISVYKSTAIALVEVCELDALSVGNILADQVKDIYNLAAVSQDRAYLLNISTIVRYSCSAGAFTVSQLVKEIVKTGIEQLDADTCSDNQFLGALYILGSAIGYLGENSPLQDALMNEESQLLLSCYEKMSQILELKVQEGSKFASYPKSEHAQNDLVELLRSILDGIGLSGNLIGLMQNLDASKWSFLKIKVLDSMRRVVEWKLRSAHIDDQLRSKLSALKQVAIENLGRIASGLPSINTSSKDHVGHEEILNALISLKDETNPELHIHVGECLVSLGNHGVEKFAANRNTQVDFFAENRALVIVERILVECAGSRQLKVRRSATIWLLCMCAAGLGSPSGIVPTTSWEYVFGLSAYSHVMLKAHDFFVTMLNDANAVSNESAIKGLAYLRLRAPTNDMGTQFSDNLFRRLRCFRAFGSSADVTDDNENGRSLGRRDGSAASTIGSEANSDPDVENAAYREVSNIAADVGDAQLVYELLYISTKNPIWEINASSSTSFKLIQTNNFSFAVTDKNFCAFIVARARSQWTTKDDLCKTKLIPWLFLLKFHSNSKVAEIMGTLWNFAKEKLASASDGEDTMLRQNWAPIFKFSLTRLENARNAKYREAACLALVNLLNGAEAYKLQDEFSRIWKTASRAVDDVMESVALSGMKLYRTLGEVSLRVAASDAQCRSQLLDFLVNNGIVSKNTVCRALSIDILLRLVKILKTDDMQEHLAPLLLKLLEFLSSLEMPELQYAQFHVEKKDQLERLRVSISQAGPVGQLLELATNRLKELAQTSACKTTVSELIHGVINLLKFGVGLNTRVGSANFVVTLANELSHELRKCNGAELLLRRVFIPYVGAKTAAENDQYGDEESRYGGGIVSTSTEQNDAHLTATSVLSDGLVIQSYCRAAAYLCPLVDATTIHDYVHSGIFAFNTSSQIAESLSHERLVIGSENAKKVKSKSNQVYTSRYLLICALATNQLVQKVPPISDAATVVSDDLRNKWYCTHVFPAAYIGQFAATDALKISWTVVLDELPPTILYASDSLNALLRAIALLLAHPAWDTRRQAAHALQALFASSAYRLRLSMDQVEQIWQNLIDSVPGRLWRGKGVVLESIVSLAALKMINSSKGENTEDWIVTLSLLFIDECVRAWKNQDLAYLEKAIENLGKFTALLPAEFNNLRESNVRSLRSAFANWITTDTTDVNVSSKQLLPPLLIKSFFEALALMWPKSAPQYITDIEGTQSCAETILWLCASVESPHFAAWSVRKAIFRALAALTERVRAEELHKGESVLERVIDSCCGSFGVADGKYSMVRVAAAEALAALLRRSQDDLDMALRLVVQRERVIAAVQTLLQSEEASEQKAAFTLKSLETI